MQARLLLIVIVCISQLVNAAPISAEELKWSARHKSWLIALTYPNEKSDDFGKEVTASDRLLLERFKPRVIISPKGLLPVDFYAFYLPHTVVRDIKADERVVKVAPSRRYLKGIERKRRYYLDYTGPLYPCRGDCKGYIAAGYGRVYRENAALRSPGGEKGFPIIVLKYNFAFPYSGLPAKLGLFKELIMRLLTDPVRFHQLDIHGAVHIILDKRERPVILLLAQHNHFWSYLVGRDVKWPEDGHIHICFAERSNEPYPCPSDEVPHYYRTVGNPVHISYVIDGRSRPITAGEDKVCGLDAGGREVPYRLKFLPDKDPLYVSWIPLGARKRILVVNSFYRNGPPGIDLNTWPEIKRYGDIMQFWYLRKDSSEDAELMHRAFKSFTDVDFDAVLDHNGKRLYRDMLGAGYIN